MVVSSFKAQTVIIKPIKKVVNKKVQVQIRVENCIKMAGKVEDL